MSPNTAFCWECSKKFHRHCRTGAIIAVQILGWDGNKHFVHKKCVDGQFVIK